MPTWKITLITICALALLLVVGICFVPLGFFLEIHRKERDLRSTAAQQPVGRELALLCQTSRQHPEWLSDEPCFSPPWTPPCLRKLDPVFFEIAPNYARVEFGGGFHHFGYYLELQPTTSNTNPKATWVLQLYSEDSANRLLEQFTLSTDEALTEDQFFDRVMAEFDRRIAAGQESYLAVSDETLASVQRCKFAIQHRQIYRLRQSIRDTARKNPDAWRDVLLRYLIDAPADPTDAAQQLRNWAASKDDFSAWLLAAYAFEKSGDLDAAEAAILSACGYPVDDPPWIGRDAHYRGLGICWRLYLAGKHDLCRTLCEELLAYNPKDNPVYERIRRIRDGCQAASHSTTPPPMLPPRDDMLFDPFAGIDVDALRTGPTPATES